MPRSTTSPSSATCTPLTRGREFHDFAAARRPGERLVEAYRTLVMDPDPAVHEPAAYAWCRWEDAHVNVDDEPVVDGFAWDRYRDPRFRLAFARR